MGILYTAAEMSQHFPLRSPLAPHPWGLPTEILPSCSPSNPLSNQLQLAGIKANAGLLAWDIGVLPLPASDRLTYGDFVHGRRNAPAFSTTSPLAPYPWGLRS